jgi:chromosomal replication initiation ATPase DnaA
MNQLKEANDKPNYTEVANIVASVAGCTVEELKSSTSRGVARPIFCYCMHFILGESQVSIAKYFGYSNHTPIHKAIKKSHDLQETDKHYRQKLRQAIILTSNNSNYTLEDMNRRLSMLEAIVAP